MGPDQAKPSARDQAKPSARELEAIELVVGGRSNAEIAAAMSLSVRTVQAHLSRAMAKTGTRTRTQLAVHALRVGLVALERLDDDRQFEHLTRSQP